MDAGAGGDAERGARGRLLSLRLLRSGAATLGWR